MPMLLSKYLLKKKKIFFSPKGKVRYPWWNPMNFIICHSFAIYLENQFAWLFEHVIYTQTHEPRRWKNPSIEMDDAGI